MCWILPDKGFNALCTMETSIVPGLPSLVRDMARDLNCLESDGEPLSSGARAPLDVSVSDEEHKSYQFLSRVAGIVFILYSGSKRKSSGAPVPLRNLGKVVAPPSADDVAVRGATTTAVVARLVSDTGSSGTKCVFTLDRYGGNWREAAAAADCVQGGRESLSSIGVNRSDKERPKGRTHISLPVTYAQLLAEVASQPPEPREHFTMLVLRARGGKRKVYIISPPNVRGSFATPLRWGQGKQGLRGFGPSARFQGVLGVQCSLALSPAVNATVTNCLK